MQQASTQNKCMTMQTCANGPCAHCTVFKWPTFLFHSTILNLFFNCTTTSTSITNIDVACAMLQDQPKTWSVQFIQTVFRAGLLNLRSRRNICGPNEHWHHSSCFLALYILMLLIYSLSSSWL